MTDAVRRLLAAVILCGSAASAQAAELRVWVVDPLIKVLTDAPPTAEAAIRISAARGEAEAGQVAFRSDAPVKALGISVKPLAGERRGRKLEAVGAVFLNYHLLEQATQPVVEGELCAKPPAMLPDAFCTENPVPLPANATRSAWITVRVPEDAAPGLYKGSVTLDADGVKVQAPIEVRVYEAVVPRKRSLKVFNWLFYDAGNGWGQLRHRLGGEPWDDHDWEVLKAIAANMAAHRQNVFTVPIIHNVLAGPEVSSVKVLKDGESFRFDFSLFDRCVETFLKEDPDGIIVGGYLALFGASGRALDAQGNLALRSPAIQLWDATGREKAGKIESMDVDAPGYRRFLKALMPALEKHLDEKGWTRNFMISVHDETFPQYARSRAALAEFIRALAPKIKFADANRNIDQAGSVDLWFPLPHQFEAYRDFYEKRQAAGDEVGFYTCVTPAGYNMNRFVSLPLLKTRLLHWYNYKFGLTAFLHWGYNPKFPPANLDKTVMDGDANLVYKDPLGMPVPSIRQEAMRDGIEDYELLKVAEARDKDLARKLCDHLVTDCRLYTRDVADFRKTRELLLELAGAKAVSPELRARINALPTDHGWLLKDLPDAPPSAEGWKLVFSDDFERQELGADWLSVCGKWAIKDGHLTMLKDGDGAVVYAKPLAPSQRIEYDAWTERGYPCDLSAILCANPKLRNAFGSAYFFGLGSEMNAFSKLLINLIEHRIIPLRMVPGKRYHVICERDGDRLSFWVDGKVVLHCLHRDRLDGPDNRHAGLYMYLPGQYADNVRLYTR